MKDYNGIYSTCTSHAMILPKIYPIFLIEWTKDSQMPPAYFMSFEIILPNLPVLLVSLLVVSGTANNIFLLPAKYFLQYWSVA